MIISDIHGSYNDLEKVMHYFDEEQPDRLIILGDILYHGPRNDLPEGYAPKKCIPLLNKYKDKILAVRGNCDAEVDQMLLDFPMMETYALLVDDGKRYLLTHGHIYNKENMPKGPYDAMIYGHSHLWELSHNDEGKAIVNTGSITFPKGGNVPTFATLENGKFTMYQLDTFDVLATMEV